MTSLPVIDPRDIVTNQDITGVIGRGNFGAVRLCTTKELGRIAVKCYQLVGVGERLEHKKEKSKREAETLSMLSHKNIIKVHGISSWSNSFGILTEYMLGGNLDEFLSNKNISDIPYCIRLRIAEELSEGINFLHGGNLKGVYVHGDIKPANILLSLDLTAKLADFGSINMAACTGATALTVNLPKTKQHTPFYTAPEFLKDINLPRKATMDVYSFGMVLYEILTRKRIFENASLPPQTVLQLISDKDQKPDLLPIEKIRSNLSKEDAAMFNTVVQIMEQSWSKHPNQRPNMQQVQTSLSEELQKINKTVIEEQVKQLEKAVDLQSLIIEDEFTATIDQFCFPFEKSSSTVQSTGSNHLGATSNNLLRQSSTILSNANAFESSTQESFHLRSEGNHDNISSMDSTQALEEQLADETTPLINANTTLKSSCFKKNRKLTISCALLAFVFLSAVTVGIVLLWRSIATSSHSVCPILPSPANGKIDCGNNECWFSCPDQYKLMTNKTQSAQNHTICFKTNSSWSGTVPYCEKVTFCDQISIPGMNVDRTVCASTSKVTSFENNSVSSGYPNGTTCHIACSSSYTLQGAGNVSCRGSSWQPSLPTCQMKECSPLNLTSFLSKSCTKGRDIRSVCSFQCAPGKHLVGKSSVTCQDSLKWSDVPPTCNSSCPQCLTGPDCKESTSWATLKALIKDIGAWDTATVQYAGYGITCRVNKHGGVFSFNWDCTCTDILSLAAGRCKDYKAPHSSCEAALAALVKKMVAKKTYPEPCDAKSMTEICKT